VTGVSVIIPVLKDDAALARLLSRLSLMSPSQIIIADAQNRAHLPAQIIPETLCVDHISTKRGRGPQIKAGIDAAHHNTLWVLHADSLPDKGALKVIQNALANPTISLTSFTLKFDSPRLALRLFAWFARWDSPVSTFGDQGYAFRKSDYDALNLNLDNYPLMEDVVLRSALKKRGHIKRSPLTIKTSARRFEKYGVMKTQWLNLQMLWRFWRGENAQKLYDIYYGANFKTMAAKDTRLKCDLP